MYKFSNDEKSVIIDIGANIGISCLYFSRLFNVLKIYAFEPVGMSYQQAMLNMSLNGVTKADWNKEPKEINVTMDDSKADLLKVQEAIAKRSN